MSRTKDDKNAFHGCCQASSNTTPENSISEDSIDDITANNNTMFHTHQLENGKPMAASEANGLCFGNMDKNFPRRPAIDVEFQSIRYTVGKFSFRDRKFGESADFTLPEIIRMNNYCSSPAPSLLTLTKLTFNNPND